MKRETGGPYLSAVFVDYDNIYLSLRRKSEEAAKRFAKDASVWLRGIESGRLITPTNAPSNDVRRRMVMNRCYGNPVPRRNPNDNSTDMNSFPFVRHHFLRAGFEVIDCPPLTAQLKNSSDIRMVMDVRDYLTHETYFDEFVILSGDADFTPVLHRLRAHARRTVIFANDFTAAPYTAISDGEVREADLIALILNGEAIGDRPSAMPLAGTGDPRREILAEVATAVRAAPGPVPLEVLAERAQRVLGHEKTIGTRWAGAGSFRELLRQQLPAEIKLTAEPPYLAFDPRRHGDDIRTTELQSREAAPKSGLAGSGFEPAALTPAALHQALPLSSLPPTRPAPGITPAANRIAASAAPAAAMPAAAPTNAAPSIQQSITRIQDACQAPPLAPHEYRLLFEVMAKEISENDLISAQTLANITQRAQEHGLEVQRDDVRFVLEVVSEADPWFEQGASANLFAGRFRNFVVARCRGQGINLSVDELDLIEAWFAGGSLPANQAQPARSAPSAPAASYAAEPASAGPAHPPPHPSAAQQAQGSASAGPRWWSAADARAQAASKGAAAPSTFSAHGEGDDFPRIMRTR